MENIIDFAEFSEQKRMMYAREVEDGLPKISTNGLVKIIRDIAQGDESDDSKRVLIRIFMSEIIRRDTEIAEAVKSHVKEYL